MQEYLIETNLKLKEAPIILDNSELRYIKAYGLYLLFVRGKEADLRRAYLKKAYLSEANLREVRNLEATINLESARFYETRVTAKEKAIIEKALEKLFVVE